MKHKHKHSQMLIASVAFLSISGCTTPVYEGQYAWSQGWRVGKVTKLITADAFLDVASRTIIWSLVKQMWVRCVPLFHRLHRRLAFEC